MNARSIQAGLVGMLVALSALTETAAASPPCGATITTNTVLDADITGCAGVALTIDASGGSVTLDLNGFTISCDDTNIPGRNGVEILDNGGSALVKNGTISNCFVGILGAGRTDVSRVRAVDDYYGFDLSNVSEGRARNCVAVSNTVGYFLSATYSVADSAAIGNGDGFSGGRSFLDCQAVGNAFFGFYNASDLPSSYKRNVASGNGSGGFHVTSRTKMMANSAVGNQSSGFMIGSDSELLKNTASGNDGSGFELLAEGTGVKLSRNSSYGNGMEGVLIGSSDNTIRRHVAIGNGEYGILVFVPQSGNEIRSSTAYGNGFGDAHDVSGACTANTWSGNAFGIKSPACIQ
jgi:parallel beta-helix repeat protein